MTICEAIVKYGRRWIQSTVYLQNHTYCYFGGSIQVMNLRWERRESRDLLQDLRDVANGIAVQHQSGMDKASKEAKRIRRAESQQRRIAKFQRMICAHGFEGLSTADQNRARKHLSPAQIMQAQREYQQSLLPAPKDPQESFFTSEEDGA